MLTHGVFSSSGSVMNAATEWQRPCRIWPGMTGKAEYIWGATSVRRVSISMAVIDTERSENCTQREMESVSVCLCVLDVNLHTLSEVKRTFTASGTWLDGWPLYSSENTSIPARCSAWQRGVLVGSLQAALRTVLTSLAFS